MEQELVIRLPVKAAFKIMTLGKECDAHSGINEHSFYHKKIVVNV